MLLVECDATDILYFQNVLLYAEAAKSGSIHLDAEKCRLKYLCPATGSQMYSIFRLTSSN